MAEVGRFTKLSLSITNNQLERSGLMAGENDNLGARELENDTNNFGRCFAKLHQLKLDDEM